MSDQPLLTYLEKKTSVKNPSDLTNKQRLVRYFDAIASQRERWRNRGGYYHRELERYLRFFIPPGASVLEIGCGLGDTLAARQPTRGVGVDISPKMIEEARRKYPDLEFCVDDLDDVFGVFIGDVSRWVEVATGVLGRRGVRFKPVTEKRGLRRSRVQESHGGDQGQCAGNLGHHEIPFLKKMRLVSLFLLTRRLMWRTLPSSNYSARACSADCGTSGYSDVYRSDRRRK